MKNKKEVKTSEWSLIYTRKAFRELIWEPFLNTDNMRETFKENENYAWIDYMCKTPGLFGDYLLAVKEVWKDEYPREPIRFFIEPYYPSGFYVGIYADKDPFSNFMRDYFSDYARDDLLKYYTDLERRGA